MKITGDGKILFICEGNVGRSQMAEGLWNHWFGKDSASSAGINDYRKKYNFKPREDIILAMREKGIDISTHKIKQLMEEMIENKTTIVVLCDRSLLPNFIISGKNKVIYRQVTDPYKSSIDGVMQVRDEIELLLLDLVQNKILS